MQKEEKEEKSYDEVLDYLLYILYGYNFFIGFGWIDSGYFLDKSVTVDGLPFLVRYRGHALPLGMVASVGSPKSQPKKSRPDAFWGVNPARSHPQAPNELYCFSDLLCILAGFLFRLTDCYVVAIKERGIMCD